jgi:outer membrane protein assembly factor BamB
MTRFHDQSSETNLWKAENLNQMKKLIFPITILIILSVFISGCTGVGIASSWPGILVNNGTVYTSYSSGVYAASAENGSFLWRYPDKAGKATFFAPPVITSDGQLVVGDYNNELHSIDVNTRTVRWTYKASGRWIAQPALAGDLIYAPNGDNTLYVLNLNGTLVWKFRTKNLLWSTPIVMDGVVYLASMDHNVYALNALTGKELWKIDCGGATIGNPVYADGVIYISTLANEVLAINTSNGAIQWRLPTGKAVWSGPAVKDGTLYFGDLEGTLYAVSEQNQKELWRYKAAGAILGSPLLTETQIVFTTENGNLVALDYSGKQIYTKVLGDKLYGTPVLSGQNLIIGTTIKENILIAVDTNGNQVWILAQPK